MRWICQTQRKSVKAENSLSSGSKFLSQTSVASSQITWSVSADKKTNAPRSALKLEFITQFTDCNLSWEGTPPCGHCEFSPRSSQGLHWVLKTIAIFFLCCSEQLSDVYSCCLHSCRWSLTEGPHISQARRPCPTPTSIPLIPSHQNYWQPSCTELILLFEYSLNILLNFLTLLLNLGKLFKYYRN